LLRRKTIFGLGLCSTALVASGFTAVPAMRHFASPTFQQVQATESKSSPQDVTATVPSQPNLPEAATQAPQTSPAPLANPNLEDEKAIAARLTFERTLMDATALNTEFESFKRGRSKKPVSLSAFRSLELRLSTIADADPANTQARDMANMMKMRQYEILRPSVEIAASANRLLYAHAMAERMRGDGMQVVVSGAGNSAVRFTSPHMTRQMAMQISESAKISEKAKALEFRRVVFGNGRRSWTYDVARGRLR
jgi:hypothetical protein